MKDGAEGPRGGVPRYDSRVERRTTRRAARRCKTIKRVYGLAGPVVVLAAVAAVLLVFVGGSKSDSGAETTSSTVVAKPASSSVLLVVEQEETVPALALLAPDGTSGLALAMPGMTLIKTGTGFKTLAELHVGHEDKALAAALTEMLGQGVGTVASVQWSQLAAALIQTGPAGPPPAKLGAARDDAALAVDSVLSLLGSEGASGTAAAWNQMKLGGEASAFRSSVRDMAVSIPAGAWSRQVLPGKLVEGVGFTYFEPDVEGIKALLAGESAGPAATSTSTTTTSAG